MLHNKEEEKDLEITLWTIAETQTEKDLNDTTILKSYFHLGISKIEINTYHPVEKKDGMLLDQAIIIDEKCEGTRVIQDGNKQIPICSKKVYSIKSGNVQLVEHESYCSSYHELPNNVLELVLVENRKKHEKDYPVFGGYYYIFDKGTESHIDHIFHYQDSYIQEKICVLIKGVDSYALTEVNSLFDKEDNIPHHIKHLTYNQWKNRTDISDEEKYINNVKRAIKKLKDSSVENSNLTMIIYTIGKEAKLDDTILRDYKSLGVIKCKNIIYKGDNLPFSSKRVLIIDKKCEGKMLYKYAIEQDIPIEEVKKYNLEQPRSSLEKASYTHSSKKFKNQ